MSSRTASLRLRLSRVDLSKSNDGPCDIDQFYERLTRCPRTSSTKSPHKRRRQLLYLSVMWITFAVSRDLSRYGAREELRTARIHPLLNPFSLLNHQWTFPDVRPKGRRAGARLGLRRGHGRQGIYSRVKGIPQFHQYGVKW